MATEDAAGGEEGVSVAEGLGGVGVGLFPFVTAGVGDGVALEEDEVAFFKFHGVVLVMVGG